MDNSVETGNLFNLGCAAIHMSTRRETAPAPGWSAVLPRPDNRSIPQPIHPDAEVQSSCNRKKMARVMKTKFRAVTFANRLLGVIALLGLWSCAATNPPNPERLEPVNYLEFTHRLVTSGKPSADLIASLDPSEYRLVINLAPGSGGNSALADEAGLLAGRGITYLAIPVEFRQPDYRDFLLFSSALNSVGNSRVWIHCQFNYRASIFTFLYHVIHEGADPDTAYGRVTEVWVPDSNWLRFARETLARHNINYEF